MYSKALVAAYGRNVAFWRKLGFIPFDWDSDAQNVVTETEQGALMKLKFRKLLVLIITIVNLVVMTTGALRIVLTFNAFVLHKLKQALNPTTYWVLLYSLTLAYRTNDGIPMLVNNLKVLDRREVSGKWLTGMF